MYVIARFARRASTPKYARPIVGSAFLGPSAPPPKKHWPSNPTCLSERECGNMRKKKQRGVRVFLFSEAEQRRFSGAVERFCCSVNDLERLVGATHSKSVANLLTQKLLEDWRRANPEAIWDEEDAQ
jgi:hypothetical protein